MKKIGILSAMLFAITIMGAEKKDLPYYDDEFPRTGNLSYLKEQCKLDILYPSTEKNFPTLVWFHGGGLSKGKKHIPKLFKTDKIAVVAVNYRLSGKLAQCPDYIYDAAAAVSWVKKHIAEYGGDPNRIYIAGHSAGGYLTAMLALAPKYLNVYGMKPHDFAGFFPISGQMTTHFRILAERREKGLKVPAVVLDQYAPIQLARSAAPSIVLLVGDPAVEWPARVEENILLAARLKYVYKNKQIECHSLPTFNHNTVVNPAIQVINEKILQKRKE